ncbi:MAG: UbiD family decarboxylase, partial [Firmicutes bacterium]|nr:UbiD family decarboxylase [Bacillota bacterium]
MGSPAAPSRAAAQVPHLHQKVNLPSRFPFFLKYKRLGLTMPMVIVIGHHPAFYMGAQTKLYQDEPQIIGGVMGEPLEVTPSETWGEDFMIPAHAENMAKVHNVTC